MSPVPPPPLHPVEVELAHRLRHRDRSITWAVVGGSAGVSAAIGAGTVFYLAATDGIPPEEYGPPNRFAFGMLFLFGIFVLPIVGALVCVIARELRAHPMVAMAAGIAPAVLIEGLIVTRW